MAANPAADRGVQARQAGEHHEAETNNQLQGNKSGNSRQAEEDEKRDGIVCRQTQRENDRRPGTPGQSPN